MNDLISTIAICVQAAGSIALFIIIQRQNRFFKTQINVQEGIINSMKTYSSLIDVEELKKFVDLSKQTMRMETDKEKVELQTKVNEVEKELKEKTSSHNVKYESIVVAFGLLIVRTLTRERRQIYINNYPDHKKDLVSIVNKFEMYIESEGKDLSLESKLDVALKQTEKALDMLSPKIVSAVINP
ncbi:MAG: hypothetical protein HOP08_17395 [Cyclobacteriaceae bacterium]|nr:hypothetical protein [Cyclobacteriaceae bacterium]